MQVSFFIMIVVKLWTLSHRLVANLNIVVSILFTFCLMVHALFYFIVFFFVNLILLLQVLFFFFEYFAFEISYKLGKLQ